VKVSLFGAFVRAEIGDAVGHYETVREWKQRDLTPYSSGASFASLLRAHYADELMRQLREDYFGRTSIMSGIAMLLSSPTENGARITIPMKGIQA
jgi:glycerol dehydrogenase-like iron-containing ADH family enzyme